MSSIPPAATVSGVLRTGNLLMTDGRMALGTWQGIYLFEHRTHAQNRELALHLIGEQAG